MDLDLDLGLHSYAIVNCVWSEHYATNALLLIVLFTDTF